MQGYQEMVAVKVSVYRENGETLTFGVYPGQMDHPMPGDTAPLLSLQTSRQIGGNSAAVFALPGFSELHTGEPWGELISLGDFVQIEATVQRTPGPQDDDKGYSHSWRSIFFGRVAELEDIDASEGDGLVYSTLVTCDDFLTSLATPQFVYWRKLGEGFNIIGTMLDRLDKINLTQSELATASIPMAAYVVLKSFIEGRVDISRKINGDDVNLSDTYGVRFEGDDLSTQQNLKQLAPEASTWRSALEMTVDAPHFYEMFQDSLPKGATSQILAPDDEGEVGRSDPTQFRHDEADYYGAGDFSEVVVIRPSPFPVYYEKIDATRKITGRYYSDSAWSSLPLIKAAPFTGGDMRLRKTRKELFSVFSGNIPNPGFGGQNSTSVGSQSMQMVGDIHKLLHVTGYVPLDVVTKRHPIRRLGSSHKNINADQLTHILGWQLFSYNQLNDIYLNGTSTVPLDLRAQLGARWQEQDMLFYIEGYKHAFSPDSASTTLTLSRGLPVEYYGIKPADRPTMKDKMNYVKKYLGRKRPEDREAPRSGRGIQEAENNHRAVEG